MTDAGRYALLGQNNFFSLMKGTYFSYFGSSEVHLPACRAVSIGICRLWIRLAQQIPYPQQGKGRQAFTMRLLLNSRSMLCNDNSKQQQNIIEQHA